MASAAKKKKRKEEPYHWKAGASSRHTTNLEQSILETFNTHGSYQQTLDWTNTLAYLA
jgi:hypothetical protein